MTAAVGYVWVALGVGFTVTILAISLRHAHRTLNTALQGLRDRRSISEFHRAQALGRDELASRRSRIVPGQDRRGA